MTRPSTILSRAILAALLLAAPAMAQTEQANPQVERILELESSGQGILLPLDGALDPQPSLAEEEETLADTIAALDSPPEEAAEAEVETVEEDAAAEEPATTEEVAPEDGVEDVVALDEAAAEETVVAPAEEDSTAAEAVAALGAIEGIAVAELGNPDSIGPYRLWLATGNTVREAQVSWQALAEANPDLLGDLKPVIVLKELKDETGATSGATYFRLQAGPLPTAEGAQERCERLMERGILYCTTLGPDDG